MLATLRHRNFALLWVGGLISMIGNWALIAALPYHIYAETGSALASGALITAYILPVLMFGSVAGVFVDRWNRRWTLIVANLAQAALILLLLLVRSTDWLWLMYLVAFAEATLTTFSGPAEHALLPRLVPEEHLQSANALNALNDNLARLIGPPIGGALVGLFGLPGIVFLDSASFLLAGVLVALMVGLQTPATAAARTNAARRWAAFWQEWRTGLQLVRGAPIVITLFIVASISTLGDAMLSALLVPFVSDVLQAGALGFGWLLTVRGIGGLIGGALFGQMGRRVSPIGLLIWSNLLSGLILLVVFNVALFPLALLLVGVVGVTAVANMISQQTLLQQSVSDAYRGRVFGAFGTTTALLSLGGTILGGLAGDYVGVVPVLNVSGVLTISAGIVAFVLWRRHTKSQYDTHEEHMMSS